jgi:hypothetical protein
LTTYILSTTTDSTGEYSVKNVHYSSCMPIRRKML